MDVKAVVGYEVSLTHAEYDAFDRFAEKYSDDFERYPQAMENGIDPDTDGPISITGPDGKWCDEVYEWLKGAIEEGKRLLLEESEAE